MTRRNAFRALLFLLLLLLVVALSGVSPSLALNLASPAVPVGALSPDEEDPWEPNNSFETAHWLDYAEPIDATIFPYTGESLTSDEDFFVFSGKADEEITAVLSSPPGGTDFDDSIFILYNEAQEQLRRTGGEPDVTISYVLPQTGTYYLVVFGGQFNGGTENPYELVLMRTDDPADPYEPNDDFDTATPIGLNDSFSASIDTHDDVAYYEDEDFFSFGVPFALRVDVRIRSYGNLEPCLFIYDQDQGLVFGDCYWGAGTVTVSAMLPSPGQYYLRLTGDCGEGGGGCDGPYDLRLNGPTIRSLYLPVATRP